MRKVRKMPLSEYIQKTRDIKVKGTINFKRTTPGTVPFSEALDPKSLKNLSELLKEEENTELIPNSDKEPSNISEDRAVVNQDNKSDIDKLQHNKRGRPKKSHPNEKLKNNDQVLSRKIKSSYNLRDRKNSI